MVEDSSDKGYVRITMKDIYSNLKSLEGKLDTFIDQNTKEHNALDLKISYTNGKVMLHTKLIWAILGAFLTLFFALIQFLLLHGINH